MAQDFNCCVHLVEKFLAVKITGTSVSQEAIVLLFHHGVDSLLSPPRQSLTPLWLAQVTFALKQQHGHQPSSDFDQRLHRCFHRGESG